MENTANIVTIVFRALSAAISLGAVIWFIIYLKRRMEFRNLIRKRFILVIIVRGFAGALSNIPGMIMLTCISDGPDKKNLVLNFFQSFFVVMTVNAHTVALYIRSCEVLATDVSKKIRYLLIAYLVASSSVFISAFVIIFLPAGSLPYDSDRCMVKNPVEAYMGLISGGLVFTIDAILLYHFVIYLRETKHFLGQSHADVPRLISQEAVKILIVTFVGVIGFLIYEFVPGNVGTVFYLLFEYAVMVGLLFWIRMKYLLDNRETSERNGSRQVSNRSKKGKLSEKQNSSNMISEGKSKINLSNSSLFLPSLNTGNNQQHSLTDHSGTVSTSN